MRPGSPRSWLGGSRDEVWVVTLADVDVTLAVLGPSPGAAEVAGLLLEREDSPRVLLVLELLEGGWELPCSAC